MILVTGASQGIGYECAKSLLRRTESDVLITGRNESTLIQARAGVSFESRERLHTCVCDQSNRSDVDALCRWLADPKVAVEGAILNIGVNPTHTVGPQRIHSLASETIQATIETNCTHTLLIAAAVLERLRRQHGGVLIWIGSQAQRIGLPGAALYCATKSFLSGLARAAHNEYSARGVRLHLLHPGVVRTPRTATFADRFAAAHGLRVLEAAEVAEQVVDAYLGGPRTEVEVNL
jgi:short-subunit dehydrogenase